MKHRFLIFNIIIILLFGFIFMSFHYYFQLKDFAVGKSANELINNRESLLLDKLAAIKLSIYSIDANELSKVREDILTQFTEEDFSGLIIQPKASFIDTLLYDSKLKRYLEQGNTKKPSKSLLNKMKLYLPNELLISFLRKSDATEQLLSIETYLTENGYEFISSGNIPSVKSDIKHYYYDKNIFSDLMLQFTEISEERSLLKYKSRTLHNRELMTYGFLLLTISLLIQLLDYYLATISAERTRFLVRGHLNPRTYHKQVRAKKSIVLIIILFSAMEGLLIQLSFISKLYSAPFIGFIVLVALVNLVIINVKKERFI